MKLNILKRVINKIQRERKRKKTKALREKYIYFYENLPLGENAVLLESRNGKEIDGNIFYILKELVSNSEYEFLSLHTVAEKEKRDAITVKLSSLGEKALERIEIVEVDSERHFELSASAKYIVSDATLENFFIKKEGQVYLNVWHGTPFKVMGRKIKHEPHAVGNVQKNFTIADYLLYPNEYMKNHMIEDYMISNTSVAKVLIGGYPRNTAFFDEERKRDIVVTNGLEGKHIYAYMPTHRPSLMGENLATVLDEIDSALREDEVLFVKIHPLAAESVSLGRYERVKAYPGNYETYEFLNIAECLITDYSSVFYDYAVSGNKIVLYTYDEEEYLSARGLYEPISSLPFPQVKNVEDLMVAIRDTKSYDDSEFLSKYCYMDSPMATKALCERFVFNRTSELLGEQEISGNGKPNVIIKAGDLSPGERTDKLMQFISDVDSSSKNYFLAFNKNEARNHIEVLLGLPEDIYHFGRAGKGYETGDKAKDAYLERKRVFGDMRIDEFIEIR